MVLTLRAAGHETEPSEAVALAATDPAATGPARPAGSGPLALPERQAS
jgi:hypothetical protein